MRRSIMIAAMGIALLLYVNSIPLLAALYYDLLPRIVNALTFFFVLPFVLGLPLILAVLTPLARALKIKKAADVVVMPPAISMITLWLGMTLFSYYAMDYARLRLRGESRNVLIEDAALHRRSGYITFRDAGIFWKGAGAHRFRNRIKSADKVYYVYHRYVAVPVLSSSLAGNTRVWLCGDLDSEEPRKRAAVDEKENKRFYEQAVQANRVQGLVIHDPYELKHCRRAARQARKKREELTLPEKDWIFIQPEADYRTVLARKQLQFIIIMIIINIFWTAIPWVVFVRQIFKKK